MRRLFALGLVLVLCGCGASGGSDAAPGTKRPTTTTEATTTTIDPNVALRRYASELGPVLSDVPGLYEDLSDCVFDKTIGEGLPTVCDTTWGIQTLNVGTVMETIPLVFQNLKRDVGTPDELVDLIAETEDYAAQVKAGIDAYDAAGCSYESDDLTCAGATGDFMGPLGSLSRTVENWAPYI